MFRQNGTKNKYNKNILRSQKNVKNKKKTAIAEKNGPPCHIGGKGLESDIVYKSTVEAHGGEKYYYGACATKF